MSNATVNVVQNFTADHALVAKAVRLPIAHPALELMSGKDPDMAESTASAAEYAQ
jgi:hypothetical protein